LFVFYASAILPKLVPFVKENRRKGLTYL